MLPLEDEISKAARQKLPDLQNRLSPLSERLTTLALPGADTMDTINQQITAMLQTDASDAPVRFGAAESPLFDGLKWAIAVKNAFDQGLSDTVRELRAIDKAVADLPGTGPSGELRKAVQEDLDLIGQQLAQRDFHKHKVDLATRLTTMEARIAEAVTSDADRAEGASARHGTGPPPVAGMVGVYPGRAIGAAEPTAIHGGHG